MQIYLSPGRETENLFGVVLVAVCLLVCIKNYGLSILFRHFIFY